MDFFQKTMEIFRKTMEIFRKTMDFFPKNSHVFRISWEIIEGTREKRREEKTKTRRNIHKGIHDKNKKDSTAETENVKIRSKTNPRQKQIHGKNKKDSTAKQKDSTAEIKRHPRQKQKQIHGRNKRNPHKIGRKEGQFVHKSKDLRSNILMQT